jgi:hypothetical protein
MPVVTKRPSAAGYWLAGVVLVLGLAAAIAWASVRTLAAIDGTEDFARGAIPGAVTVPVRETGKLIVYYEANDRPALQELELVVRAPDGGVVPVSGYGSELEYDVPGRAGVVAQAVATFDATTAGVYTVSASAPAEPGAQLAVGESVGRDVVATLVQAGGVALGAAALAAGIALLTERKRRLAK